MRTALYYVTITDTHIRIGCQQKTISEWKKVTTKDVFLMGGVRSARAWRKAKSFIMFLAEGGDHG